jgi:predicted lipase
LLRERRDKNTGGPKTRYDWIIKEVEKYLEDKDWRLCVTGHSLGGALATLFGFYAATDDRIIKNGQPVELYTFASPLVGDQNFRQAFKALETKGKIVHARICNEGDLVTMLPAVATRDDSWLASAGYQHVGLQIQLRKNNPAKVFYNSDENWLEMAKTTASNVANWVSFLPRALGARSAHSLPEYERRLVGEIAREEKTNKNGLNVDLDQYYAEKIIKDEKSAATPDDESPPLTAAGSA